MRDCFVAAELSDGDLNFIVREMGSIEGAIAYCKRISSVNGPLSNQYTDAAMRLATRLGQGNALTQAEAEALPHASVVVNDLIVIANMQRFGGHFVKALGAAAQRADMVNLRRLRQAFPELWEKYGRTLPSTEYGGDKR